MIGLAEFLVASLVQTGTAPVPQAVFERELEKIERARTSGVWKDVRKRLDALLEAHREKSYVAARIFDVLEDYRDAAFAEFSSHRPRPAAERVVRGELERYHVQGDRAEIEIAYEAFGEGGDFLLVDELLRHPALLLEEFEVEITAVWPLFTGMHDQPPAMYIVGDELTWAVSVGSPEGDNGEKSDWYDAKIFELPAGKEEREIVSAKNEALEFHREYTLTLSSKSGRLRLSCNGKPVLQANTRPAARGSLGLRGFTKLRRVAIRGSVGPAWIQGLLDEANAKLRAEFGASYDPAGGVPDWLLAQYHKGIDPDPQPFPDAEVAANAERWKALAECFDPERAEGGLALLEQEPRLATTPAFDAYARAVLLLFLDRTEEAQAEIQKVRAADPLFRQARLIDAALAANHERAEAVTMRWLVAICVGLRDRVDAHQALAAQFLRASRLDDAKLVIEAGILSGIAPQALTQAQSVLSRARRGPNWTRVFEWRSEHYLVRSDLDIKTCYEITGVLEKALRLYEREWARERRSPTKSEPYPVYVFSGNEGYLAHVQGIFGERPESTAGLYSPTLKQLLAWNLPDRDDLMRTLRHEGLHQHLDSVLPDPPTWLNEGLAEYYETAESQAGRWKTGAPLQMHVAFLEGETHWKPLEELLGLPHEEFYNEPRLHYAESWALVHYLLHAEKATSARFEEYFDELREEDPGLEGFARLFGDGDGGSLAALEGKVRAHVATLAGQ